jgi:isopentenyl diphosphate isomerase/L-lactate dehydrogenase-like FMN-dependent dehydrogenase
MCLGATGVLIGRPYLWGLSYKGEDGIVEVLEVLKSELKRTMVLLGRNNVSDFDIECLWLDPPFVH